MFHTGIEKYTSEITCRNIVLVLLLTSIVLNGKNHVTCDLASIPGVGVGVDVGVEGVREPRHHPWSAKKLESRFGVDTPSATAVNLKVPLKMGQASSILLVLFFFFLVGVVGHNIHIYTCVCS